MKLKSVFLLLALLASSATWSAGFLEREVYFSEAEIQAQLDKSGPLERRYGGMLTVSLLQAPIIRLGNPEGRAAITARVNVTLLGNPAVPVEMTGTAGVRYDDKSKAFYLENPVAESVQSQALPRESESMARQAVTQLMTAYFRAKPVYVLREDGPEQERAARWLLRSVRIEAGRVAAILSPL